MTTKRKRTKRNYFTQENEDAIIKYNKSTCNNERRELYVKLIQPAFNEMVEKIIYTYKFTALPNIEDLRDECKVYLTTILEKYNPEKGSKAFSYFSVITKNWFIHQVKRANKRNKQEINIDNLNSEHQLEYTSVELGCDKERQDREFWAHLWVEMEAWEDGKLKDNENKVLQAIKIILSDFENQEMIFNKKAIYLYIREITGLNTKQVVNNLNKLRVKYIMFKNKWDDSVL